MASLEQLKTALRNADAAGDVDAARQLAQSIKAMQATAPAAEAPAERSVMGRIADAYQRGRQQLAQGSLLDKGRVFANDLTFNAFDPALAAVTPYTKEELRQGTEEARERLPAGFEIASGLMGGLASGGGLAKAGLSALRFAPAGRGLAAGAGRAAISGAEQGGLSALSAFNRGADTSDIGTEALVGGVLGGGGSAAGGLVGRLKARRAAAPAVKASPLQTKEDAFAASAEKYKAVKDAGGFYQRGDLRNLRRGIEDNVADVTLDPVLDVRSIRITDRVMRDLSRRRGVNPEELDKIRQRVKRKLMMEGEATDREVGGRILDEIRRFEEAAEVVTPTGKSGQVNQDLRAAQKLYGQGKRTQRVEEASTKAMQRAEETGSGFGFGKGNLENTRRQEFGKLMRKSDEGKLPSRYSPDERELLDAVRKGSVGRNAGRLVAGASPLRGGLPLMLNALAAIPSGGGAPAASLLLGEGAALMSRKATERAIDDAMKKILTGVDPRGDPAAINAMRDLLARLGGSAARTQAR